MNLFCFNIAKEKAKKNSFKTMYLRHTLGLSSEILSFLTGRKHLICTLFRLLASTYLKLGLQDSLQAESISSLTKTFICYHGQLCIENLGTTLLDYF